MIYREVNIRLKYVFVCNGEFQRAIKFVYIWLQIIFRSCYNYCAKFINSQKYANVCNQLFSNWSSGEDGTL